MKNNNPSVTKDKNTLLRVMKLIVLSCCTRKTRTSGYPHVPTLLQEKCDFFFVTLRIFLLEEKNTDCLGLIYLKINSR